MSTSLPLYNEILNYFIQLRKHTPHFYFAPRIKNNRNRKEMGYWFLGNDDYVHLSFWNGKDWKEKIHNIGFVVHSDRSCKIELSAQDSMEKAQFLRQIINKIPGFEQQGNKNKWWKHLDGDYMPHLKRFLVEYLPLIDEMIINQKPKGIDTLDEEYHQKYAMPLIATYLKRNSNNNPDKITRITWNKYRWQRPSGPEGKSLNKDAAFEAASGYGQEEWLLDRMKILPDGYHYGFLRGLDLKTRTHVGKTYNIHLYTKKNVGVNYYIGTIYHAECISPEKSKTIYTYYKKNGWLEEMRKDLEEVHANVSKFNRMSPERFFNIRFKFENLKEEEVLKRISQQDINISTYHFKLLPFLTNLHFDDPDDRVTPSIKIRKGIKSLKNTNKINLIYNVNYEYDPYHDKIQNKLFELLNSNLEGYSEPEMEGQWVDLKARAANGERHYFEIKTDMPKNCIRKALGQIMEYAYYPCNKRADKLFVIGDTIPNVEAQEYLKYLRTEFGLPIFYRALDINKVELSCIF